MSLRREASADRRAQRAGERSEPAKVGEADRA
jgi:hypothetical protein